MLGNSSFRHISIAIFKTSRLESTGRGLVGLLLLSLVGVPTGSWAQKYRGDTTAVEITQLPKYCYYQYVSDKYATDPVHSIQGCGAYTNHFCPGLIDLMRAQSVKLRKPQRIEKLRSAKNNFSYTLHYMPPNCWLRQDAESAMRQAEMLGTILR
jgi:hypothetical protein